MPMLLAWRYRAKFGDFFMKYDNYISKTGGRGANKKNNEHINPNERKIDMRMTSDQMEQSPLDPENVRSLKHKGSGVSCFKTDHFFPFIMYLPCGLYIVSTGPCIYNYKAPDKEWLCALFRRLLNNPHVSIDNNDYTNIYFFKIQKERGLSNGVSIRHEWKPFAWVEQRNK